MRSLRNRLIGHRLLWAKSPTWLGLRGFHKKATRIM